MVLCGELEVYGESEPHAIIHIHWHMFSYLELLYYKGSVE